LNSDDTKHKRVDLQRDISALSLMNNIFSRTRKRDVVTDESRVIRNPHQPMRVQLTENEQKEFDKIINDYIERHSYIDEYNDAVLSQGHALGLIQKKRRISSSIFGYLNSEDDLNHGIDRFEGETDTKFEGLRTIVDEVVRN